MGRGLVDVRQWIVVARFAVVLQVGKKLSPAALEFSGLDEEETEQHDNPTVRLGALSFGEQRGLSGVERRVVGARDRVVSVAMVTQLTSHADLVACLGEVALDQLAGDPIQRAGPRR